jgi:hypothetical protein
MDGWQAATGERPTVDPVDRRLHDERTEGRGSRRHRYAWRQLPTGAFVAVDDLAHLVLPDRLVPWTTVAEGYGAPVARPTRGDAALLTPPSTVAVLAAGYRPQRAGTW